MKTIENVFYTEEGQIYLVPNHYSHSLAYFKEALEYAESIGLTLPDDSEIRVEVLAGRRYARKLSIEFKSETLPNESIGFKLTPDSGLWEDLKY